MNSILQRLALIALLILVSGSHGAAGEFNGPDGFSLTYPDDWVAIHRDSAVSALPPELRNMVDSGQIDTSKIAVAIYRNGPGNFRENVNVSVLPQQKPVSQAALKELVDAIKREAPTMGMKIRNLQGSVTELGTHDVIMLDYEAEVPGVPFPLAQRQVYMPAGSNTYIITCSATPDTLPTYLPTFDKILSSIKAPPPKATGFDVNRMLTMGIVGGIIGGLVGLINWARSKFGAKPETAR